MKLEHKITSDYVCDLTKELDKLAGIDEERDWLYHYLMVDKFAIEHNCLPLRVPGGTVGGVWYDEEHRITKIDIVTGYVVETCPDDVKERVQKYIGTVIDFGNVKIKN